MVVLLVVSVRLLNAEAVQCEDRITSQITISFGGNKLQSPDIKDEVRTLQGAKQALTTSTCVSVNQC